MIFINRKRIKNNQKDVSKYWYVEKYVYGILKETVEIPLGTGIAFESIDSGYNDDKFYGWSLKSDSTSATFNSTSTYSNTTNAVKKNLDENNTLRLYAVYSYIQDVVTQKVVDKTAEKDSRGNITCTITVTDAVIGSTYAATQNNPTNISQGSTNTPNGTQYYPKVSMGAPVQVTSGTATSSTISVRYNGTSESARILTGMASATSTPTYSNVVVYSSCHLSYYYLKTTTKFRVESHS